MNTDSRSEGAEDVSWTYVPGSIGRALVCAVPWAPRATPASDKARAEAMTALNKILSKYRQRPPRAPVAKADFQTARDNFWSNGNASMGFVSGKGGRR
jgi:hypothetical protein